MWTSHPNLLDKVKLWWGMDVEGTAMFRVARKFDKSLEQNGIWSYLSRKGCFI